jgi:hypothetical protein
MDFNLRPVSKLCAATGQELQPGETCWSVLIEQQGSVVRQDYSSESWQGPPEGAIGYWQCVIPEANDQAAQKLDVDALFDYFVQLCESPNHIEQDYQYVLALLLLRKRRLMLEDTIEIDDQPVMRLAGAGGEGPFEVVERQLSDEQILQLQTQLYERPAAA